MRKVYVYKEYCDSDPYDNEIVKVFADKKKAEAYLRAQAEDYFFDDWDNIVRKYDGYDPIDPDYIAFQNDSEEMQYFIIEEQQVIE